jgi:hypothetical protein
MYLVIEGSVTVIASLLIIWDTNKGMTDPRLAITLPYRVHVMTVFFVNLDLATATFSIIDFEIPIAFIG